MENNSFQYWIDSIFEETFEAIEKVYESNREKEKDHSICFLNRVSRLVFPQKRDKKTRVSEQELRFLFVEVFNKNCNGSEQHDYYYSVETPTKSENSFKGEKEMSARLDLTIHDKAGNRKCMIEFKNISGDADSYWKDFVKLAKEFKKLNNPECLCYFVSIAEASDGGTIENSKGKGLKSKFINIRKKNEEGKNPQNLFDNTTFICHSINPKGKGFKTIYARKDNGAKVPERWELHEELFWDAQ